MLNRQARSFSPRLSINLRSESGALSDCCAESGIFFGMGFCTTTNKGGSPSGVAAEWFDLCAGTVFS